MLEKVDKDGMGLLLSKLNYPFPPSSVACSRFAPPLFKSITDSQLVSKHDRQILLWALQFSHEEGMEGMGVHLQGMLAFPSHQSHLIL